MRGDDVRLIFSIVSGERIYVTVISVRRGLCLGHQAIFSRVNQWAVVRYQKKYTLRVGRSHEMCGSDQKFQQFARHFFFILRASFNWAALIVWDQRIGRIVRMLIGARQQVPEPSGWLRSLVWSERKGLDGTGAYAIQPLLPIPMLQPPFDLECKCEVCEENMYSLNTPEKVTIYFYSTLPFCQYKEYYPKKSHGRQPISQSD